MPSSYTPSLRLTLPVTGELAGTWGSTVNTGVTTLAEAAIAGTAAVAMTDADYTLTVSNGATDQARNMFITLTGTLTVSRNVICPAVSKLYVVTNSTTGSQNIVFKTSAGAGITVANGQRKMVYCNGTDVLDATTSFTSIIFDAGTVSAPSITFAGSTNTGFWRPAVSTVALSTAGLERLRVDSSGNVGIGTASPTAVLDVRGASYVIGAIGTRVTDTSAGNGFEVVPSTTNNVLSYNRTSSTYLPIRWRAGIQSWEVDNTERMRLDASGNLGIGTAAPEQRLHLSNTGSTSVAIKFTNSAASAGIISYSSDSMLFYTANAIRATIDTSGNLGIGTSSPASTLDVRTSTGATIIAGRTSNVGASSQPGALNFTAPNASGSARTWAGIRAVVGTATAGSESASIIFSNQVAGAYTDTLTLDSSGNLGLGVTPTYKLDVYGTGSQTVAVRAATSGDARFYAECAGTNSGWMQYTRSLQALQWSANGATQHMTLDSSGNLGIGTSSPAAKLNVVASSNATDDNTITLGFALNSTSQALASIGTTNLDSANGGIKFSTASAGVLTERATIDSSGNLGLGVTPSTWGTGFKVFETTGSVIGSNSTAASYYLQNAYYNGTFIYKTTSAASYYAQGSGSHIWYTAPSGTAGTAITFTQAMTLDASGNLLVGGTSVLLGATGRGNITLNGSSNALLAFGNGGVNSGYIYSASDRLEIDAASTRFIQFNTNGAERARLDTSGNLGLGVTPTTGGYGLGLQISDAGAGHLLNLWCQSINTDDHRNSITNNAYNSGVGTWKYRATGASAAMYETGSGQHRFYTAPSGTAGSAITFTQAMTLDASGNRQIGTTSAVNSARDTIQFQSSSGGTGISLIDAQANNTAAFVTFYSNTTPIGSIANNGNAATSYNTSSDYRLKDITGPITTSGAYIDSLNPVEGTWKADGSTFVGLIAHEVQEVSRTTVATGEKDGEQMQAMDYSNAELVANLIAEIQSLRARVAALEAV